MLVPSCTRKLVSAAVMVSLLLRLVGICDHSPCPAPVVISAMNMCVTLNFNCIGLCYDCTDVFYNIFMHCRKMYTFMHCRKIQGDQPYITFKLIFPGK